ncbi:MAG: hypothetical protein JRN20_00115 [Nitrososphaerota archaeon]|nr:hypothetical protein [Nitrososphaerota archaeon]MDG6923904.1 hypothetical protein [Nitrososphaerota archaeon]
MKTQWFFVYCLLLSFAILSAFYYLIGYTASNGYPEALGSAFRKGLEISLILSAINWIVNRVRDLKRKLSSTIDQVNRKLPK